MGRTFKYRDFVNKLRFQVGGVCPEEFCEYGEKYIKSVIYTHSLKAAKALYQESTVNDDACEVITQTIAEWTYHKIIDLMNGDIPEVFHERIINKVNEAIYDFLLDENRARPLTWEIFSEPDVVDLLDIVVKDTYRDALSQLYSDRGISKDTYKWALSQSHIDSNDTEDNLEVRKKGDIFSQSTPYQIPYKEIFMQSPWLFAFYIVGIIISMSAIILFKHDLSLIFFSLYLIILIIRFVRRAILDYHLITHNNISDLEEQIEDLNNATNPNAMYQRLGVDVISLQVGLGLVSLADPEQKNKLLPAIAKLRKDLTDELGYIIPNIRVMDSTKLKSNECIISIRSNVRDRFFVDISAFNKEEIIVEHIRKTCIKHVNEVFTKTDVLKLMELVRSQDPTLVNDLIPELISAIDFRRIVVNLLREEVSIKDIILIFERLCDFARFNNQPIVLTERLRAELGVAICLQHSVEVKDEIYPVLYVLTLSSKLEKLLENSVQSTELGTMFLLKPAQVEKLVESVANALLNLKEHREKVVLMVTPKIRAALYGLLSRHFEDIKVLAYSELITDLKVEKLGEIS